MGSARHNLCMTIQLTRTFRLQFGRVQENSTLAAIQQRRRRSSRRGLTKFGMGASVQTAEGFSTAILSPPRTAEVMRSKHSSGTIGEISVLTEPISFSNPLRFSASRENLKTEVGLSRHMSLDEEGAYSQTEPLINNQRRRRCASESNICQIGGLRRRQQSFRDGVGHAASETFLLTRLSFKLLRYLG